MNTPSTQYLLQVSFLLYSWEWRRIRTSQAKSTQHGPTVPLLHQECKTSHRGECWSIWPSFLFHVLCDCFRLCLKTGGDLPPLLSDTTQLCPSLFGLQAGKAPGHSSACAQYMWLIKHVNKKIKAPRHSPPGSSELSNTKTESHRPSGVLGGRKSPILLTPRDPTQGIQKINYSMRYTATASLEGTWHFWIVPRHLWPTGAW